MRRSFHITLYFLRVLNCLSVYLASCSSCDTLFNSLMDLEHHKEALGHWSDDEDDDDEGEDEEEDDESDIDYDYYFGKSRYV